MIKKTYLQDSLKNGKIMRWADSCMPLKFYIAPFRFYDKKGEDYKYKQMVMDALMAWQKVSMGKATFALVNSLNESQINLEWKRVDRQALGHCYFNFDSQNRLFSAEVKIGISDGLIHKNYMAEDEVYHTILHEIGHALGLGHSPFETDIMYTPHKYGVVKLSEHDKATLQWLYKLNIGTTASELASKYNVGGGGDIDEVVARIIEKNVPSEFEKVKKGLTAQQKDLLQEQEKIADLRKYNLALQDVKISDDVRKFFVNSNFKKI